MNARTSLVLTESQETAVTRLFENNATILVAATGVGKTIICLTAVQELIEAGHLKRVIVACPAKVASTQVWSKDAAKWDHINLQVEELVGSAAQRLEKLAVCQAHIIVVSLNNLDWLLQQDHRADGIIVDELSKAAGRQTVKLKSKKYGAGLQFRVGLSATPVSQDFQKLYGMCRIIDNGKALGTSKQKYLSEFFDSDYLGYNLTLKGFADASIMGRIAPLVHLIKDNKADVLPKLNEKLIRFDMPDATRDVYNEMKRHMVIQNRQSSNQAVKSAVLRELASGFFYTDDGLAITLDRARLDEAVKWIADLKGRSGLIFYEFIEQREQLERCELHNVTLAQIQSMSHGVEGLQHSFADLLFFAPVWSRDQSEQSVGRVWRTGQKNPVTVTTLVCNDTLDDLVLSRVEDRSVWMKLFKQHLGV